MSEELSIFSKEYRARKTEKVKKEPKKRSPIRPMSKKMTAERKTYRQLREEFLSRPENMFCAVFPHLRSCQVHHKIGRQGSLLNDTSNWLAVSHEGHARIENFPEWAKEFGFSGSRLKLIKPLNKE
ncbi:hypothetical protein [Pedobacter sp.]|uniref:hypothetical protein n=1 Tax=Pedobacter sp. TaxID=1411316 RepID=UPI003C5905BC